MNLFDKECQDVVDVNINMTIPWYIMASYAYYEEDNPILSDSVFDNLVKKTLAGWDSIEHIHKDSLSLDMLHAGTYSGKYPSRIKPALDSLRGNNK